LQKLNQGDVLRCFFLITRAVVLTTETLLNALDNDADKQAKLLETLMGIEFNNVKREYPGG